MGARPAAWNRRDAVVCLLAAAVALATRLPLRSRHVHDWDAGLLASGLIGFDFDHGYPHPPFYPLAVALGKIAAPLAGGAVGAFPLVAALASAGLVALTYALGRQMAGPWTSGLAAAIVLLSPVALFNGVVGHTYMLEGLAGAGVAWFAWQARQSPSPLRLALVGVAASIAAGLRPSSLFVLLPLAAWAAWGAVGRSWTTRMWANVRALLPMAAGGVVASLVWGTVSLVAGGGLRDFLRYNGYQSRHVVFTDSVLQGGWPVVPRNAAILWDHLGAEAVFLVAVASVGLVFALLARAWWPPRPATSFLAAWILPPIAFYVFVYVGWPIFPSGYLMVLLPPVALASALTLASTGMAIRASGAPRALRWPMQLVVVAVALMPVSWAASWDEATEPVAAVDSWADAWSSLEEDFPANETALLTFYSFHFLRVEHPDHVLWGVAPIWAADGSPLVQVTQAQHHRDDVGFYQNAVAGLADDRPHPIPANIRTVLVVEGHPAGPSRDVTPDPLKPTVATRLVTLSSGATARAFDAQAYANIESAIAWFNDDGGPIAPANEEKVPA